jgi:hypothetical protein
MGAIIFLLQFVEVEAKQAEVCGKSRTARSAIAVRLLYQEPSPLLHPQVGLVHLRRRLMEADWQAPWPRR